MSKLLNILNTRKALTLESSGSRLLDFFATVGGMRKAENSRIINNFNAAYAENPEFAVRALFFARDIRGGLGERHVFRVVLTYLANSDLSGIVIKNLDRIADFGRWDDLCELLMTKIESQVSAFIAHQLKKDLAECENSQPISLLAKWLPSANTSSKTTVMKARRLIKLLGMDGKSYRKILSKLRAYNNIVEREMCAKEFGKINYEKVSSGAGMKYQDAFLRNDGERYRAYLGEVTSGTKKINTKTLYPYDIINPIFTGAMHYIGDQYYVTTTNLTKDRVEALDVMWKNLPDYFGENGRNCIAVVDTSGSMRGAPIKVAVSLGIYLAERSGGPFSNHFISFSEQPTLQEIKGGNIVQKVIEVTKTPWGGSTNLQGVFDLILNTATRNNLKQEDLPERLFIISDMEFNKASTNNDTNYGAIVEKYAKAGYKAPELVFWNVNSVMNSSPVTKDESGVVLVSGCTPSILSTVLKGEIKTPYQKMLDTLTNERYNDLAWS